MPSRRSAKSKKSTRSKKRKVSKKGGSLLNYSPGLTEEQRRAILKKQIKNKSDIANTIKLLNIIALYDKNREPDYSKIYKSDIAWLQTL